MHILLNVYKKCIKLNAYKGLILKNFLQLYDWKRTKNIIYQMSVDRPPHPPNSFLEILIQKYINFTAKMATTMHNTHIKFILNYI